MLNLGRGLFPRRFHRFPCLLDPTKQSRAERGRRKSSLARVAIGEEKGNERGRERERVEVGLVLRLETRTSFRSLFSSSSSLSLSLSHALSRSLESRGHESTHNPSTRNNSTRFLRSDTEPRVYASLNKRYRKRRFADAIIHTRTFSLLFP